MRKIAVTGGIACGKTSVCSFLREMGAYVISADAIVHSLLTPDTEFGKRLLILLGNEILEGGQIDRKRVAKKIFHSPPLLQEVEGVLHPEVQKEIETSYRNVSASSQYPLFVAEVPLLFESGQEAFYDAVVVVYAPETLCRLRFSQVTGYETEEFTRRISRKLPLEELLRRGDFIIKNEGSLAALKAAVIPLFYQLQGKV